MAQQSGSSVMTGKPLIESDRVEGTTVYDPGGNNIGSIKRLMIEKVSGRVAYAVMSFGGFLGLGAEEHAVPWKKLTYDTSLGGYRTDITEQQLRGAPASFREIETTIGPIAAESASCTIIIAARTTGTLIGIDRLCESRMLLRRLIGVRAFVRRLVPPPQAFRLVRDDRRRIAFASLRWIGRWSPVSGLKGGTPPSPLWESD